MEQHPVPQNVTSFQFRLVGDMTLKQFGYLAAGAILAFISYKLPLPFFFRWPLTFLFGFLGFGFAFIPIEERPMDVWVLSFIKSVYSPTQYVWRKHAPRAPTQTTPPPPPTPTAGTNAGFNLSALKMVLKPAPPKEEPATDTKLLELQKQLTTLITEKQQMEKELASLRPKQSPPQPPQTGASVATPFTPLGPTVKVITPETAVKAGLPRLTSVPNVVSGIVKDNQGNLLPAILVTVRDRDGVPLRALKTNKVGQFAASTPLPSGVYMIEVEDPRDRFVFDRAQITLTGAVMSALEIIAKSQKQLAREKLTAEIFGENL